MKKFLVSQIADGRPVNSVVAATWTHFLNGIWTKDQPTRAGKYFIANSAGRVVGEVFVFFDMETDSLTVRIRDGALCKLHELDQRNIWWWSVPVPLMLPSSPPNAGSATEEEKWGTKEEQQARRRCRELRDAGVIVPNSHAAATHLHTLLRLVSDDHGGNLPN